MFTGIVEELGEVVAIDQHADSARLTVRGPRVVSDARHGDSISVNGCCLTVVSVDGETFTVDVMKESLDKTSLGALEPGSRVNLERAVTVNRGSAAHRPGPRRRHRHDRRDASPASTGRSSRSSCRRASRATS